MCHQFNQQQGLNNDTTSYSAQFEYDITDDGVVITKCSERKDKIIISEKINEKEVTKIGKEINLQV